MPSAKEGWGVVFSRSVNVEADKGESWSRDTLVGSGAGNSTSEFPVVPPGGCACALNYIETYFRNNNRRHHHRRRRHRDGWKSVSQIVVKNSSMSANAMQKRQTRVSRRLLGDQTMCMMMLLPNAKCFYTSGPKTIETCLDYRRARW